MFWRIQTHIKHDNYQAENNTSRNFGLQQAPLVSSHLLLHRRGLQILLRSQRRRTSSCSADLPKKTPQGNWVVRRRAAVVRVRNNWSQRQSLENDNPCCSSLWETFRTKGSLSCYILDFICLLKCFAIGTKGPCCTCVRSPGWTWQPCQPWTSSLCPKTRTPLDVDTCRYFHVDSLKLWFTFFSSSFSCCQNNSLADFGEGSNSEATIQKGAQMFVWGLQCLIILKSFVSRGCQCQDTFDPDWKGHREWRVSPRHLSRPNCGQQCLAPFGLRGLATQVANGLVQTKCICFGQPASIQHNPPVRRAAVWVARDRSLRPGLANGTPPSSHPWAIIRHRNYSTHQCSFDNNPTCRMGCITPWRSPSVVKYPFAPRICKFRKEHFVYPTGRRHIVSLNDGAEFKTRTYLPNRTDYRYRKDPLLMPKKLMP